MTDDEVRALCVDIIPADVKFTVKRSQSFSQGHNEAPDGKPRFTIDIDSDIEFGPLYVKLNPVFHRHGLEFSLSRRGEHHG